VNDAGGGSRIFRLRRKILLLLEEKRFKHLVSIYLFSTPALRQARSACLRAF
jgi:hypothetical protein